MALVYLLGGGPGDPKLITVKGKELLERADLIAYDDLIHPQLLMHAKSDAELLPIGYRGLRKGKGSAPILHPRVMECALEGKVVVRLKAGDPTIFGRAYDEYLKLKKHNIAVEIVPGITAMAGAAASLGLALTMRGVSSGVTIETGHIAKGQDSSHPNTRVVYMPKSKIEQYCDRLISSGDYSPETAAAFITSVSSPLQKIWRAPLHDLARTVRSYQGDAPGIVVIGDSIGEAFQMKPEPNHGPLYGYRILLGRKRPGPSKIAESLTSLGAEVIEAPQVKIQARDDYQSLDENLKQNHPARVWIFACDHGVQSFFQRLAALNMDIRHFSNAIGSLGPKAKQALLDRGIQGDFHVDGICDSDIANVGKDIYQKSLLLLGPSDKTKGLVRSLNEWAYNVEYIPAYNRVERNIKLVSPAPDLILAPSSTTAQALWDGDFGISLKDIPLISMGPITSAKARSLGFSNIKEASRDQGDSLIRCALQCLGLQKQEQAYEEARP